MDIKYKFLQLRFRRIFATIMILISGVLLGHISLFLGLLVACISLIATLVFVVVSDLAYKKEG